MLNLLFLSTERFSPESSKEESEKPVLFVFAPSFVSSPLWGTGGMVPRPSVRGRCWVVGFS